MTRTGRGFDPYKVLGLARGASYAEVRAAHRAAILRNHPDLARDDPEATRQAQRINAARDAVSAELTANGAEAQERARPQDSERPERGGPTPRRNAEAEPHDVNTAPSSFRPPAIARWEPTPGPWARIRTSSWCTYI